MIPSHVSKKKPAASPQASIKRGSDRHPTRAIEKSRTCAMAGS